MTNPEVDLIQNVSIYLFNYQFYVVGLTRLQPLGLRREVLPPYIIPSNNLEKLTAAIELARQNSDVSKSRYFQNNTSAIFKTWDGDHGKVWNNATKSWSIDWFEDGTIEIRSYAPSKGSDKDFKKGTTWNVIDGTRIKLFPPTTTQDTAKYS